MSCVSVTAKSDKNEENDDATHSQHNIRFSVHQSHPLTGNPKGLGLVGEETAIRCNLGKKEKSLSISLSETV